MSVIYTADKNALENLEITEQYVLRQSNNSFKSKSKLFWIFVTLFSLLVVCFVFYTKFSKSIAVKAAEIQATSSIANIIKTQSESPMGKIIWKENSNEFYAIGCELTTSNIRCEHMNKFTTVIDCSNECLSTSGCTAYNWQQKEADNLCCIKTGRLSKANARTSSIQGNGSNCGIIKTSSQLRTTKNDTQRDEEKSLKTSIDKSLITLHQLYVEFQHTKSSLDFSYQDHFKAIQQQMLEQRNDLKNKIDKTYEEMLVKMKDFETIYAKQFNKQAESILVKIEAQRSLDDERNELYEKFRNLDLTLDTLKLMQSKQNEPILEIQFKLEQMNEYKNILLNSNEFKANVYDKSSFGSLSLYEIPDFNFKSKIINAQQTLDLMKVCGFLSKDNFTLLYRGSDDGFGAINFHSKCDGISNTLTIIKPKYSANIFGAFASASWERTKRFKADPNAFIFSLINRDKRPLKMNVNPKEINRALYYQASLGTAFGHTNCDIWIHNDANLNNNSHADLGSSFNHPKYVYKSNEARTFLAGAYNFQLSEIEVYRKF